MGMPRSCPKCRRNPVAGVNGPGIRLSRVEPADGGVGEADSSPDDAVRNQDETRERREDAVIPSHATDEHGQAIRTVGNVMHNADDLQGTPSSDLLPGAVPDERT